jgi:hypothetical protein
LQDLKRDFPPTKRGMRGFHEISLWRGYDAEEDDWSSAGKRPVIRELTGGEGC